MNVMERLTDPPFFFVRRVGPYTGPDTVDFGGVEAAVVGLDVGLTIYGARIATGEPPEYERRLEERGWIYTWSYSVACPEGEPGSQPVSDLREITCGEFVAAMKAGWPA